MTVRVGYDLAPELITSAGVGRYARELRLALQRRDDVEIAPLLPHRARGRDRSLHVITQGLLREIVYYGGGMDRQAARAHADVVHTPAYAPMRSRLPYVLTIHDVLPLVEPQLFPPVIRVHFALTVRPRARRAARVLTDTEHGRAQLLDVIGLAPERVAAIPLGVGERFTPGPADRDRLRTRFGIDRPYVLCVGTLEPRKNLLAALQAVERAGVAPDVALVVAGGQGWHNEAFEREAERSPVPLVVTGRVSDEELVDLYRGALCLLFPSLWEGYGLPPVEAMACGCPVVATDRPTVPEVVGDAALLVDPTDVDAIAEAVGAVVRDEALRESLRRRGSERAAGLTWARTAERTAAVYRAIVAEG